MSDPTFEDDLETRPEQDEASFLLDRARIDLDGIRVRLGALEAGFTAPVPDGASLAAHALLLADLHEVKRQMAEVDQALKNRIGTMMASNLVIVEGFGAVHRTRRRDRKQWDTDALKSAVLDSRLIDTETGEVIYESPADKITAVWNLGAPRVTALRARTPSIDPDDFATVEDRPGWDIRLDHGPVK